MRGELGGLIPRITRRYTYRLLPGGPDGRASELGRGGVERGCHPLFGLSGLHTIQQIVEFDAEVFESARLYLHQRLEFFVEKSDTAFGAPCSE